jgi:aspartate-semialdehyde dehydrogenase
MINVAVVGATGMVGQAFIQVLEEYQLPIAKIVFLASERSKGKTVTFNGHVYPVEVLDEHSFDQPLDYALFSAGGDTSKKYAPIAAAHGVTVIDNSSAWRMDPSVPLIVPEVNPQAALSIMASSLTPTVQRYNRLSHFKPSNRGDLSASFIQRIKRFRVRAIKGVADLKANLAGQASSFYPKTILHNVIPHIDVFLPNGATKEEEKMVNETRKILDLPNLRCTATCVRVPVFNGHSVAINVELEKSFELEEILVALEAQGGLKVLREAYPTPLDVSGQDLTLVGRVRRDESVENGLNLWVVADNIRKGAASNAIQIMQKLMEDQS